MLNLKYCNWTFYDFLSRFLRRIFLENDGLSESAGKLTWRINDLIFFGTWE